jgi:hypothetical protein
VSASAALKAARAAGIRLGTDGDDLLLEADAAPPSAVLGLLSRYKIGVIALLRNQTGTEAATAAREIDQAEREAIVIGEDEQRSLAIPLGHIPAVYADAFAKLLAGAPADVPAKRWHRCIIDAVEFLDQWGEQAARLGWGPDELFGLHPVAPLARYDNMGTLWLLKGERVVALTETEARLNGLACYRKPLVIPRCGAS